MEALTSILLDTLHHLKEFQSNLLESAYGGDSSNVLCLKFAHIESFYSRPDKQENSSAL
jgi:hypothetical protein